MAQPRVAIIYDGTGNVRSVAKAFERVGASPRVTMDPGEVAAADAVVLPGQGAAGGLMGSLVSHGMDAVVRDHIGRGRPFFGVCLGLQVLFDRTEEDSVTCLGVLPGLARRLPTALKVPHMGWNQVRITMEHPLYDGVPDGANFYFVHSFYADPEDRGVVAGVTDYGISMCSVAARGNLVATQFHPEKSGDIGLRLYENFVQRIVSGGG